MKRRVDRWLIGLAMLLLLGVAAISISFFRSQGWNPFHQYGYIVVGEEVYVIDYTDEWLYCIDKKGQKQRHPSNEYAYEGTSPYIGIGLDYWVNPFTYKPPANYMLSPCWASLAEKGHVFGYSEEELGATHAERETNLLKLIRYYYASYNERLHGEVEKPEIQ